MAPDLKTVFIIYEPEVFSGLDGNISLRRSRAETDLQLYL